MRNAEAGDVAVPSEDRNDGFYLIVSDLVSLIDHVQASIKLIEAAKVQDCTGNQEFADVVVLDDVTPLYTQAEAALAACNTNLTAALQFLLENKAVAKRHVAAAPVGSTTCPQGAPFNNRASRHVGGSRAHARPPR